MHYLVRYTRGKVSFEKVEATKTRDSTVNGYCVHILSGARKGKTLEVYLSDRVVLTESTERAAEVMEVYASYILEKYNRFRKLYSKRSYKVKLGELRRGVRIMKDTYKALKGDCRKLEKQMWHLKESE
jgi:propanediol dehydratase small subunit